MLVMIMIISGFLRKSSLASSIPSYVWIISLPSMALWLGWLAAAFIFQDFYLEVKGKKENQITNKSVKPTY